MAKSLFRTFYIGALVLGLTTVGAHPSFAQSWLNTAGPTHAYGLPAHCPPGLAKKGNGCRPPGLTHMNGPTATGPVRAHDRMSQPVLARSNGPNAVNRDIRRDPASQQAVNNSKANAAKTIDKDAIGVATSKTIGSKGPK